MKIRISQFRNTSVFILILGLTLNGIGILNFIYNKPVSSFHSIYNLPLFSNGIIEIFLSLIGLLGRIYRILNHKKEYDIQREPENKIITSLQTTPAYPLS